MCGLMRRDGKRWDEMGGRRERGKEKERWCSERGGKRVKKKRGEINERVQRRIERRNRCAV